MSNMFDIPKEGCSWYEEVRCPHQIAHLTQHLCPRPPSPLPRTRPLYHRGRSVEGSSQGVAYHKTYNTQNCTVLHYYNKLNVECVDLIKCTVQNTNNVI